MTSTDPAKTDQVVDQRMRAEQLVLLFRQSRRTELVSSLMPGVLCIGMGPTAPNALLLGWLALLSAMALVRLALARRFKRSAAEARNLVFWEHRFVASFGVAGGTTTTFAVHPRTVTVAVAAIIGPAVL